jgi:hypothetical protein
VLRDEAHPSYLTLPLMATVNTSDSNQLVAKPGTMQPLS